MAGRVGSRLLSVDCVQLRDATERFGRYARRMRYKSEIGQVSYTHTLTVFQPQGLSINSDEERLGSSCLETSSTSSISSNPRTLSFLFMRYRHFAYIRRKLSPVQENPVLAAPMAEWPCNDPRSVFVW